MLQPIPSSCAEKMSFCLNRSGQFQALVSADPNLGGKEAMVRVPLLTAAILGFATFHHAIGSSAFAGDEAVVIRRLTRALQACI